MLTPINANFNPHIIKENAMDGYISIKENDLVTSNSNYEQFVVESYADRRSLNSKCPSKGKES
jgi:hypothetical protein